MDAFSYVKRNKHTKMYNLYFLLNDTKVDIKNYAI